LIKPIQLVDVDIARFWSKIVVRGPEDCWEWLGCCDKVGYGRFRIHKDTYAAHRVAFAIVNGDTQLLVCHKCATPGCCNPAHLYAGTQNDSVQQCIAAGRFANMQGAGNGRAKLTVANVREIRQSGAGNREIAKEFGISSAHVSMIRLGKRWGHI
jgi:hypothetical protein